MTSILTNTGAMTALQTLRSINANLAQTQNEISTGKSISSAKDNSAVWAISKVMESDVAGFKAIKNSLSLGESSVAVARNATESITDLLTDIKSKIVASQEENVDREKIQTDITQLRNQINSIVNAAQFNGLNLIKGTDDVNVLSSLDRAADGTVTSSNITVNRQDMTTAAGTYGSTALSGTALTSLATVNGVDENEAFNAQAGLNARIQVTEGTATGFAANDSLSVTIGGSVMSVTLAGTEDADGARDLLMGAINARGIEGITATAGANAGELVISNTNAFDSVAVSLASTVNDATGFVFGIEDLNGAAVAPVATSGTINQRAQTVDFSTNAAVEEGLGFEVQAGGRTFRYVAGAGETMEDVARGLKTAIDANPPTGVTTRVQQDSSTGQWSLAIDNDVASPGNLIVGASTGGTASGGLFGLDNIDVRTDTGAAAALENIETMIQSAIDASAAFGSAQSRVETQSEFVSKLTDSLTAGIGTMVDADLEEASARLQALQVQQQLGIQSLSIANQAPQTILALFR